jgi:hypothetical protein
MLPAILVCVLDAIQLGLIGESSVIPKDELLSFGWFVRKSGALKQQTQFGGSIHHPVF